MADLNKILKNMLGDGNAEAIHQTIKEAQKALDTAGVARKAAGDTASADGGDATPVLEAVGAAGATEVAATVKGVIDALNSMNALAPDVDMNALLAALVKAVAAPEATEDASTGEDPTAVPGEQSAMAGEMMKSLTEYIASTTKDMGEMARTQMQIVDALTAERDQNAQLIKRIEVLEKQIGGTPRIASKAAETVIDPGDKNHKALLEAAQKSVGEEATFLGIPVKKEYVQQRNGKK